MLAGPEILWASYTDSNAYSIARKDLDVGFYTATTNITYNNKGKMAGLLYL